MKELNRTVLIAIGLILLSFTIATNFYKNVSTLSLATLGGALLFAILASLLYHFYKQRR